MSDVEALHEMDNDTFLHAGRFLRGQDRRASARIPLTKPVRVGPPGGLPQSPVSAADLSSGGLFIDADRPVRIGARFSVQVPLANGTSVYVEEAEVVYNRQTASAPGFGVRFIRVNPSSQAAIQEEIDRLSPKTLPRIPQVRSEDAPTVVPAAFGGDVAVHPVVSDEPSVLEETLDIDRPAASLGPPDLTGRPSSIVPWRVDVNDWFWRHARRLGLVLGAVAAVTVLTATVVFLWSNPRPDGDPSLVTPRSSVTPDTHRALMEAKTPAAEVVPPPPVSPAPSEKKNPLPGPDIAELADRFDAEPSETHDRFDFPLSPQARVKRTMIFRSPERFVVDLTGQDPKFDPPDEGAGGIRRVRVGRHPGFIRLVLDAERPIEAASAEVDGDQLRVSISYR